MFKVGFGESIDGANLQLEYIEMDPCGRYGRYREILGKGAMKTVYKAFDDVLAMEVAWNQVHLDDVFRSPDELQRLYSEVHLLKSLNHDSIIRFYASWIDAEHRTFNFITEMFTSGNLREYRQRLKRVDIRAVKNWARQILSGLAYLHGHDPPVIHRDLKCDNIFVNGHLGQVKIGDLGLAAILRGSQHAHSVIGTPEFMAPELYEEDYDQLVDVYSFGMCVLEMLTSEYPYSECSNPAQIYKRVTSGKLPEAYYRIQDVEAQCFVRKCLETAGKRPSAQELLADPFLAVDEGEALPIISMTPYDNSSTPTGTFVDLPVLLAKSKKSTEMIITGTMDLQDETIFLKVKINDKDGQARNVYFPFDIQSDTAIDVAKEMVKELEIADWEPLEIAEMIDEEISALVPSWKESQCDAPLDQNQHSFHYNEEDDDDDDRTQHPFYNLSSPSSSHSSLPGLYNSHRSQFHHTDDMMTSGHHWVQENFIPDDDASSQSSLNSHTYSNFNYFSGNEKPFDLSPKIADSHFSAKTQNCTRFSPEKCKSKNCYDRSNALFSTGRTFDSNNRQQKITQINSMMDIRSQLLHRSLVEMINRRRLCKTVGAVVDIGYKDPGEFCGGISMYGDFCRTSSGNLKGQGFKLW